MVGWWLTAMLPRFGVGIMEKQTTKPDIWRTPNMQIDWNLKPVASKTHMIQISSHGKEETRTISIDYLRMRTRTRETNVYFSPLFLILNIKTVQDHNTGCLHRIQHRKWSGTKLQPSRAKPAQLLGCCLVPLHFRCWSYIGPLSS